MKTQQKIKTKRGVVCPREGRLNTFVRALNTLKHGFSINSDYSSALPNHAQERAFELEFERMKTMTLEQTRRKLII